MRARRNPWLRLAVFSLAAGLFALGYWWGNRYKQPETPEVHNAILLRPALHLPDFRARDYRNTEVNLGTLRGRWTLLLAGRLDDPGTPRGLVHLTRIYNRLAAQPDLQRELRILLLSPTPGTDGPRRLQDTVFSYNPGMDAAAGDPGDLAGLFAALGVDESTDGDPALYLLDPETRVQAVFTIRDDPAGIAADLREIQQKTTRP